MQIRLDWKGLPWTSASLFGLFHQWWRKSFVPLTPHLRPPYIFLPSSRKGWQRSGRIRRQHALHMASLGRGNCQEHSAFVKWSDYDLCRLSFWNRWCIYPIVNVMKLYLSWTKRLNNPVLDLGNPSKPVPNAIKIAELLWKLLYILLH